eukprot:350131-Chlamydomonas_euryale.AAC.2
MPSAHGHGCLAPCGAPPQVSMSVAGGGRSGGAQSSLTAGMLSMLGMNQCGADFQRKQPPAGDGGA